MEHTLTFTHDELNIIRLALDEYYYQTSQKLDNGGYSLEMMDKLQERTDIAERLYKRTRDELWFNN